MISGNFLKMFLVAFPNPPTIAAELGRKAFFKIATGRVNNTRQSEFRVDFKDAFLSSQCGLCDGPKAFKERKNE